jgi:hypothetical protein
VLGLIVLRYLMRVIVCSLHDAVIDDNSPNFLWELVLPVEACVKSAL